MRDEKRGEEFFRISRGFFRSKVSKPLIGFFSPVAVESGAGTDRW